MVQPFGVNQSVIRPGARDMFLGVSGLGSDLGSALVMGYFQI